MEVILRKFFPDLTEEERLYIWFKKDSATAYTARMFMQALSDVFGDRIIRSGIWLAHSTLWSFFFWDFLKDEIYNSNPQPPKGRIKREHS